MAKGQTRGDEGRCEGAQRGALRPQRGGLRSGQEALAKRDHATKLEHGQLAVHKCALSSSARRSHQAPRWPSPARRIKAAQGDAMKWLKEKPQTVTKLEQELHQVREQITQLKAREKELMSKLKVEESKQGALTRSKVTQAKLLLGSVFVQVIWPDHVEGHAAFNETLRSQITRPKDTALFGDGCTMDNLPLVSQSEERRRCIILGAILLNLIHFDPEVCSPGKIHWSKVRLFLTASLSRRDHRRLFGLPELSASPLCRNITLHSPSLETLKFTRS